MTSKQPHTCTCTYMYKYITSNIDERIDYVFSQPHILFVLWPANNYQGSPMQQAVEDVLYGWVVFAEVEDATARFEHVAALYVIN